MTDKDQESLGRELIEINNITTTTTTIPIPKKLDQDTPTPSYSGSGMKGLLSSFPVPVPIPLPFHPGNKTKDNNNSSSLSNHTNDKNGQMDPVISVKLESFLTETTDLDSMEEDDSSTLKHMEEEDPGDSTPGIPTPSQTPTPTDTNESLKNEISELQQLLIAKESEWNALLKLKKLKEILLEQKNRRKEILRLTEQDSSSNDGSNSNGNGTGKQQNETSATSLTSMSIRAAGSSYSEVKEYTKALENQIQSTENEIKLNSSLNHSTTPNPAKRPRLDPFHLEARTASSALQQLANNRSKPVNRIIGEGRQGAIVDVQSIINNHRAKTANETITNDPAKAKLLAPLNQSLQISYSEVLLTLAKISTQDASAPKPIEPPAPVNLPPVKPNPRITNSALNSSNKNRNSSNTTLAKLLSSNNSSPGTNKIRTVAVVEEHKNFADENGSNKFSQHQQQRLSVDNNISLNDLLGSGKNGKDASPKVEQHVPICQGCNADRAQFVCAGCANQWYCSRECQVGSWDEHSEVCSG